MRIRKENIIAVGNNITWKKGKVAKQYHLFLIMMLLGRLSLAEERKGREILGKKIKIRKSGGGEEYKVEGNLVHPW